METFAFGVIHPLKMGMSKSIFGVHMHQKLLKPTMLVVLCLFVM